MTNLRLNGVGSARNASLVALVSDGSGTWPLINQAFQARRAISGLDLVSEHCWGHPCSGYGTDGLRFRCTRNKREYSV